MKPERIELDIKQVDALLKRLKKALPPEDYEIIKAMADTIYILSRSVDQKAASIRRLLRMLFGAATEKLTKNKSKKKQEKNGSKGKKKDKKGHGRKSASDYTGAKKVNVPHDSLKPGDKCPECSQGKVYEMQEPKKVVRITGNAPLSGTVYQMQRLRCNICGMIFTANTPEDVGEEKYDNRSKSLIAVLKYGTGMPFNRLENLQQSLGIPLPASTQFDIVKDVADIFEPVLEALIKEAAQGDVIHNDDTTMKVLELMQENQQKEDVQRKGIFTTGILSTTEDHKIALFFTGRKHAGENLKDILEQRTDRSPPIQMCDALSRNIPRDLQTLLANCMAHGRRNFVDVLQSFPEQCLHVLEILAEVYKNDGIARDKGMNPDERLRFHQQNSGPLMDELHAWLQKQLDQHLVEPNSGLGKAINYMLKHWRPLTLFLREAGAPLDNNICERALKKAILHRKNALFYKTMNGARVGDLFMSMIHTCNLADINPIEYFTALQEHADKISQNPERWLPWNYTTVLQPDLS
jgi:transposase